MNGRKKQIKKTNKIKYMEKREIKNMHILKDSKVKFVSAVGVHLPTSFWMCLWFFHSSRSYCLTLERKKEASY